MSRLWGNTLGPGFPPPASGPGPVSNKIRQKQAVDIYGKDISPANAPLVSAGGRRVGDYTAPILQPWAAQVVKEHGEKELNDGPALNPINQCRPSGVPFVFYNLGMEMLQQPNSITMLYVYDHEVRHVRLNQAYPAQVTPSWSGDSVGHYEGDTLVVDTVGVKTDRPYAMQDLFGTPYTDKLHIVERYRLRDYDDVKDALERNAKENWLFQGDVFSKHRGKFMQVHVTVEDAGVFTSPFTATITYVPSGGPLNENACAENPHEYYNNKDSNVPKADKPDF
jgi:hypothetical protein